MATFESAWQFYVDPFTAQTFYRESVNSPWIPLNPSDYHPTRPESHDVRKFIGVLLAPLIWYSMQVLTYLPNESAFTANPVPEVRSHGHGESATLPSPPTQEHPQPLPPTQPDSPPATAAPALQNLTQTGRTARRTQRLTRAYDPTRGQRAGRPIREGGRGRTRGAPNYKPREVQVLLDLVEEELPISSKGWKVVGSWYQDWAVTIERPERSDRSLELKYKQACFNLNDNIHSALTTCCSS